MTKNFDVIQQATQWHRRIQERQEFGDQVQDDF
jgi:hypothetical protein